MNVKEFRESKGLDGKQVVSLVRETAPKFDKFLLSKVENPDQYGVRLLDEVEQNLLDTFGERAEKPPKKEARKKPCRVSFRLGKMKMRRLQEALATEGFQTMQQCMEYIVTCWLEERVD